MVRILLVAALLVVTDTDAKPICSPGTKYRVTRTPDGTTLWGCSNGKTYTGHVQVRDVKARLVMEGEYRDGEMDGVWLFYDGKGRVVKKPLFDHGKLVAEDTMSDDEADDGGGGE